MSAQPAGLDCAIRPILLVEADLQLGRAIAEQLGADGYRVALARTSEHARILAGARAPRLAVLGSLESPRRALDLLQEIRRSQGPAGMPWDRALPVIVLDPRARALDMLRAFDAGADDVLVGRPRYLELRARIAAILRRTEQALADGSVLAVGPLAIDSATHTASLRDQPLALRRMEFALLAHLAGDPQRVFTRDELLRSVWGYRSGASTRTVDSHASRLRRKLAAQGDGGWVVNVWGVGYRLT
ncbi:MAG TPA: response regulator transcription factor [Solirubrobacteraceae bacterium]|nr:response regulator transcription factor [Solirubrobacteraceae bacterium]